MRGCTQVVTIWNRLEPQNGTVKYYRFVVPFACKWKLKTVRTISDGTASIVNTVVVIMPESGLYRAPDEWDSLSEHERARCFTIKAGDIMAIGDINIDITGERPFRESDVRKKLAGKCMTVKAFQDNTAAAQGKHYKIEGV